MTNRCLLSMRTITIDSLLTDSLGELSPLSDSKPLTAGSEKEDSTANDSMSSPKHKPDPGSTITSTPVESSHLPVVGPYDLGHIKTSLLRGKLSDDDKHKVLKHLLCVQTLPVHYIL